MGIKVYAETGKLKDEPNENLEKVYHYTVKKVTNDYETMNFNTAISQLMIFINSVYKADVLPREYAEGFLKLLNPVCPHITEELWNIALNHESTITYEKWPEFDEAKTIEDEINLPVQLNGKLKVNVKIPLNADEETAKNIVHQNEKIVNILEDKIVIKEIYVKNKIYNIVVK